MLGHVHHPKSNELSVHFTLDEVTLSNSVDSLRLADHYDDPGGSI